MRIPTGSADRFIYFVAVDSTDLKTRETGLGTFTVYASLNGAVAAAFTTPTINETDAANMPGVYELLLDEQTALAAGNDAEELCLHITQADMAPVTRVVEIYRPEGTEGNTIAVESDGDAHADLKQWLGSAPAALVATFLQVDIKAVDAIVAAAQKLSTAADSMLTGTVDDATVAPTTTQFEADDITEATADHFIGRVVLWTSGALNKQAAEITDYALQNSKGFFTVLAMTEAPANDDTFIIV